MRRGTRIMYWAFRIEAALNKYRVIRDCARDPSHFIRFNTFGGLREETTKMIVTHTHCCERIAYALHLRRSWNNLIFFRSSCGECIFLFVIVFIKFINSWSYKYLDNSIWNVLRFYFDKNVHIRNRIAYMLKKKKLFYMHLKIFCWIEIIM